MTCRTLMIEVAQRDPPATEAVKKLLDQNITQVTEIPSLCDIRDRSNFSQLLPSQWY